MIKYLDMPHSNLCIGSVNELDYPVYAPKQNNK